MRPEGRTRLGEHERAQSRPPEITIVAGDAAPLPHRLSPPFLVPLDEGTIGRLAEDSRLSKRKFMEFPRLSNQAKLPSSQAFRRHCCQVVQRLLKGVHRHDPHGSRRTSEPRLRCPQPGPTGCPHASASLRSSSARPRRSGAPAVELELARRRDLVAAVDVASELLHDLEREGEPGRGADDGAGADLHGERQLDVRALVDDHPDHRMAVFVPRAKLDRPEPARVADAEPDAVAGLAPADQPAEIRRRSHGASVDRDDHVARLELPDRRACPGRCRRSRRRSGRRSPCSRARAARRRRRCSATRTCRARRSCAGRVRSPPAGGAPPPARASRRRPSPPG